MKDVNELSNMLQIFEPDKLERRMEESLQKVQNKVLKVNPLSTMVQLYIGRFLNHLMDQEKFVHGNVEPSMNKGIDVVQSLIVAANVPFGPGYLTKDELQETIEALDELFLSASMYVNAVPGDELIKYSQGMQMNVSGTLYPAFEKEHFQDVLLPYNELFLDVFKVTASDIVEGLLKISEHLRTIGFMEALLDSGISLEAGFSEELLLSVLEYFNVERITGWPLDFIKELALQPGECRDFFTTPSQVMLKESPIKYKPFLGIGDKYYCFSIDNLIDNFYRTVLRALRRKDPGLSNAINRIQQELSETIPFKLFKEILPMAQMYQNVFYKAPVGGNGKNEWCECDGVIVFDDVMIILEVKGGALSPVSPFSDEEAYKDSLRALAQNPYEQSLRFFEEYKWSGKIEIYRKESKKRYELVTSIKDVNFIQACCVTLDDFNEIASQIEKTEFIQESDLPVWCISMNDLRIYPELFDSPSIFLNYLYQRSQASKNPYIKVNDEMDHVGLYFEHNDYAVYINGLVEETGASNLFISNYRDDIDTYMARKVNSKLDDEGSETLLDAFIGPYMKPEQEMDPMFKQMIKLLDSTKDTLSIRAARHLLSLGSDNRTQIHDFLSTRAQKLLEFRGRPALLTPCTVHNYKKEERIEELPVIMIFLLHASNKLLRDVVERKRFLMERVMYEDEPTLCILLGVDRNKELRKAVTQIITPEQFQAMPTSAYNLLQSMRAKIMNSREVGEL